MFFRKKSVRGDVSDKEKDAATQKKEFLKALSDRTTRLMTDVIDTERRFVWMCVGQSYDGIGISEQMEVVLRNLGQYERVVSVQPSWQFSSYSHDGSGSGYSTAHLLITFEPEKR